MKRNGRPPKPKGTALNEVLTLRVTRPQRELFLALAARRRVTVSEMLRTLALTELQEVAQ